MIEVVITNKNGNQSRGKLLGSAKRIIENANYLNSIKEENDQIVKINIIRTGKDTGYPGCKKSNAEYDFKYDEVKKQYLY